MKPSKHFFNAATALLISALLVSSCNLLPSWLRPAPGPDVDPEDMFELPEVKVEVDIPEDIEDPDYTFTLRIDRIGTVIGEEIDFLQADLVEVVVKGKDNKLFGNNEKGEQIARWFDGECEIKCQGEVGYTVIGEIERHCTAELRITPINQPTTCTSDCAPGIQFSLHTFGIYTGTGDVFIKPIYINFKELARGESRIEEMGNMRWEAKYTLISFSGLPHIRYCGPNDIPK